MMDNPFAPDEQKLIERLNAAPRPRLRPAARDAIRQQIIRELHTPTAPVQRPLRNLPHLTPRLASAVVAVFAVGLFILAIIQAVNQPTGTTSVPTTIPVPTNQVAVVSSETPALSGGGATPTVSESPSSSTPELTLSLTTITQPVASPTLVTETLPSTLETVVVVEGPIMKIENNVITIYDYDIEVEPQHPILALIDTGDTIRVEGALDSSGQVLARVIGNIPSSDVVSGDAEVTVSLDGPIEAIAGNLVTVNGIVVEFERDDPVLNTLQVGTFVSVEGNFVGTGQTIVLVVVNITVINNVTNAESPCWFHDDGMGMGHWHCDGMGMGMGDAMGMGMGMGE